MPLASYFWEGDIKRIAEKKVELILSVLEEKQVIITLDAIIQALMASKSVSELEASRAGFSNILGPRIADLISTDSESLIAVSAEAITNIFSRGDYRSYFPFLETTGAVDKLADLLEKCDDPKIQTNILTVLTKLAEYGSPETVDAVLQRIPFDQLANLLSQDAEEWHESMFTILMSLTKAGKSKAVEKMFAFEIEKNLIKLLENGSEVVQHHAIVTLKAFYELAGPHAHGSLQPANLSLLPWQVRLRLERFVFSDRSVPLSPKPQSFEDVIHRIIDGDNKQVLEAMQELIPFLEKAGDPRIREMLVQSPLVEKLSELLQYVHPEQNSIRSESALLLTRLACTGGEPCIEKILDYDIIPVLVKLMQCNVIEVQDSAYAAIHQMLFSTGGFLILSRIIEMGLIERIVQPLENRTMKTRELNMHCVLDIVELGNKACLERMLSSEVVEKLVKLEKARGGSGETLVEFLKGMDKCKHLSIAERKLMKQQVVRKVRAALKGHKLETQIVAALEACLSEGPRGSSGSGIGGVKHRKYHTK